MAVGIGRPLDEDVVVLGPYRHVRRDLPGQSALGTGYGHLAVGIRRYGDTGRYRDGLFSNSRHRIGYSPAGPGDALSKVRTETMRVTITERAGSTPQSFQRRSAVIPTVRGLVDVREDFATDSEASSLLAGHQTARSGQESDADSALNDLDVVRAGVDAQTRLRDTLQTTDDRFAA